MRTLLLASALVVAISAPALACRGTAEFPQAAGEVTQSKISPERKAELMEQLSQGQSLHEQGHRQGDMGKLAESLRILDAVLAELGR